MSNIQPNYVTNEVAYHSVMVRKNVHTVKISRGRKLTLLAAVHICQNRQHRQVQICKREHTKLWIYHLRQLRPGTWTDFDHAECNQVFSCALHTEL